MGRPHLGTKCTCTGCSERFYDLNRLPAICPKCGVEQPPEKPRPVQPPRGMSSMRRLVRQPAMVVAEEEPEPAGALLIDDADGDDDTDDDDDVEIDADTDPERHEGAV
jgi:uncharacterized protein (TIGR02300 family)